MEDDGEEEEHMDVDENAFDAVEKDCLENGCSLPATQHLQIKVIFLAEAPLYILLAKFS